MSAGQRISNKKWRLSPTVAINQRIKFPGKSTYPERLVTHFTPVSPALGNKSLRHRRLTGQVKMNVRGEQAPSLEPLNLPVFINLVGIETPGLTSSVAIAKHVGWMVDEIL